MHNTRYVNKFNLSFQENAKSYSRSLVHQGGISIGVHRVFLTSLVFIEVSPRTLQLRSSLNSLNRKLPWNPSIKGSLETPQLRAPLKHHGNMVREDSGASLHCASIRPTASTMANEAPHNWTSMKCSWSFSKKKIIKKDQASFSCQFLFIQFGFRWCTSRQAKFASYDAQIASSLCQVFRLCFLMHCF